MKRLGIWLGILLLAATMPVKAGAQGQILEIPVTVITEGGPAHVSTVELTALTPGAPMPKGSSGNSWRMELTDTGVIPLPWDSLGGYEYAVRQVPDSDTDCIYDDQVYRLRMTVTVTEDGTAMATALVYGQDGGKVSEIRFRNRCPQPVRVTIKARKTMDGGTPKDDAFAFRLISEDGEVLQEVKNRGRQVIFAPLEFRQTGTYRYYLKEVRGEDGKIQYDRTVYTVIVEVTLDGDYRVDVRYERNGKSYSGTPAFANYTDTGLPKTGDDILRWVAVLCLSGAGLAAVGRKRKKS